MIATIGAEGLINSRPLAYQSANPADNIPLTPNHFLYGQIGGRFAPLSGDLTQFNLQKRWRRAQELVGEVVIVISPDTSRGTGRLGEFWRRIRGLTNEFRLLNYKSGREHCRDQSQSCVHLEC